MIDPYYGANWPAVGMDLDPFTGEVVEDPLLAKAMAPLSLHNTKPLSPPPSKRIDKRIDMRLAQPGTEESMPGYMTPLASYTAQTFWYFWHADIAPASGIFARRVSEDLRSSASRPFDNEGRHRHLLHGSVHPEQVLPNLTFCQFVISILHSTQVSFSVTILALMYTYKYKKIMALGRRPPYKTQVTEAQGFVTALMLANKYLDDNTYTNSTWAAFLKISVKEVNDYELEWLDALQFNLNVGKEEFETWRAMLDAHVATQNQRADAASNLATVTSPGRARSESPPLGYYSPPNQASDPTLRHKRSARDAFATDAVQHAGMYEAARLGPRKSSFVGIPPIAFPTPSVAMPSHAPVAFPPGPTSTLGRSSSLNRQIARLPNGARRDSGGQENAPAMDLRHAAAVNAAHNWQFPATGNLAVGQPRLMFLQAAATPLTGPDGRFHKSIPHYADPSYNSAYARAPPAQQHEMMDIDMNQIDLASPTDAMQVNAQHQHVMAPTMVMPQPHPTGPMVTPLHQFPEPRPAAFANAGPPGYAYGAVGWPQMAAPPQPQPQPQPHWQRTWKPGHLSRWSTSSDEGFMFNLPRAPVCQTEWPTPIQPGL